MRPLKVDPEILRLALEALNEEEREIIADLNLVEANYKLSRTHTCKCGWVHIVQGPFSCWACQETLSFAKWQTGKEADPTPSKVVVERRPWTVDFRDRTKAQYEFVWRKGQPVELKFSDGPVELGWPQEAGLGRYSRKFLDGRVESSGKAWERQIRDVNKVKLGEVEEEAMSAAPSEAHEDDECCAPTGWQG
jgi:hypothetical protein